MAINKHIGFLLLIFLFAVYQSDGYSIPTLTLNVDNPVKYGSPVSLACKVELPPSDGFYISLEWGRTETSSFVNDPFSLFGITFSSRGSDPPPVYNAAQGLSPPDYVVTFDMSSGISFLNISSVVLEDTGFYWCSYSTSNDPKGRTSVPLTVYAVAFSISLSSQSQTYEAGDTISLISGETYDLLCAVEEVTAAATITWEITDSILSLASVNQTDVVNSEELGLWDSLSKLSLTADWSLHNRELWCNASVSVSKASTHLILDVRVPPEKHSISLSDSRHPESYTEGAIAFANNEQEYALTCSVQDTRPPASIVWKINGELPLSEFEISQNNSTDGSGLYNTSSLLRLNATKAWHRATFECTASLDIALDDYQVKQRVVLEVLGLSDPPAIFGSMNIVEEQEEKFTCIAANGYPEATIQWLLNDVNITQSSAENVLDNEHMTYLSESILNFTPDQSDNGKTLTCEVTRMMLDEPMVTTSSGTLNVNYSPRVTVNKLPNGPIEDGGSVTLTCSADANPPSSHFDWVKGDDLGDGSNTLTLDSITQENEGSYRCKAQNGIGMAGVSEPVDVHVLGASTLPSKNDAPKSTATPSNKDASDTPSTRKVALDSTSQGSVNTSTEVATTMRTINQTSGMTINQTQEGAPSNSTADKVMQTTSVTDAPTTASKAPTKKQMSSTSITTSSNGASNIVNNTNVTISTDKSHFTSNSPINATSTHSYLLSSSTSAHISSSSDDHVPTTSTSPFIAPAPTNKLSIMHEQLSVNPTSSGTSSSSSTTLHPVEINRTKSSLQHEISETSDAMTSETITISSSSTHDRNVSFPSNACIPKTNDLEKAISERQQALPDKEFRTSTVSEVKVTVSDVTVTFPRSQDQLDVTVIYTSSLHTSCPVNFENGRQAFTLSSALSVIAVSHNETGVTELQKAIELEFMTKKPNVKQSGQLFYQPKCSWWDTQNEYWSDDGCQFLGVEEDYANCQCEHLTLFTLVGQTIQLPHTDKQANILSKLSSVAHAVSIIFLILTLIGFFYSGLYKTLRIFIHINLAVALLLSHIFLWVAFEGNVKNSTGCSLVAGFAHFLTLTSYFWICMEAIHLLLMIRPAGTLSSIPIFVWLMICWVVPLLITLISAVTKSESYGFGVYKFDNGNQLSETNWCWLDVSDGTVWAFGAPATILLVIHFALLVLCIQAFVESNILEDREEEQLHQDLSGFRLLLLLFPLVGLPWLFRLTYFHQYTVFFDYFYALMNALQGVFIFLNQCILDQEVLDCMRSKTVVEFQMAVRKNQDKQDQMDVLVDARSKRVMAQNMGSNESVRSVQKLFSKRHNTVAPVGM